MSFTYDVTTPLGQTRLLCQDTDSTNAIFQDTEITFFLNLNNSSVRLAAAQALDQIAASEVFIQKKIKSLDLSTDGPALATAYRSLSDELRRQEYEGDGDYSSLIDWAEEINNDFQQRERLIDQALRLQSP